MTTITPSNASSRFHPGEQAVQMRVGVRETSEAMGQRAIRAEMPEQHRVFFAQLPFLVFGALDRDGQPWATLLSGSPGFAHALDAGALRVDALPAITDPLYNALSIGSPVGVLGLEPSTRRRNRVNGLLRDIDDGGFVIGVAQSFGNCPQYIRIREVSDVAHVAAPVAEAPRNALDNEAQSQIAGADTFFIATYFAGDSAADTTAGADVSHRGGKPGFVRVDDARTLVWPDFRGNAYFNTLGNLYQNPRAGLLFVDFISGDFLHVAGDAEILWDDETQSGFAGAQRLVRLHVREVRRVRGALPAAWREGDASPSVARTGEWAI